MGEDDERERRKCLKKRVYLSERDAQQVADHMRKKYRRDQEPYGCPICGRWHLRTRD